MMESLRRKKINILLTAVIICISVVALSLTYIPMAMGYKMFSIKTGSMSPTIEMGSMVFVEPCKKIGDYSVGDIVTFTDKQSKRSFTHRITGINTEDNTFTTKGDANEAEDPSPTSVGKAVGKVVFIIPHVGKIADVLSSGVGKVIVAVIYIAWLAIEIELFLSERKKYDD